MRPRSATRRRDRHRAKLRDWCPGRRLEHLNPRIQAPNFGSEIAAAPVGDEDFYIDVLALVLQRGKTS